MAFRSILPNLLLGIPPAVVCSFLLINKTSSSSPLDLLTNKKREEKSFDKREQGDQKAKDAETKGKSGVSEGQSAGTIASTRDSSPQTSSAGTEISGKGGQEATVTGVVSSGGSGSKFGGIFSDLLDL
ncbi:hypothetical protein MHC_04410 [Mycoplasma haemocanis str. Illinois]|uniref:Uncharacterized protein n=1 Tax=Mycoplasma haemocanis (strain Illinois) TaxID=1111676 RepID=H6N7W6_MYCHN|nr:hypothetical protein [Mycoplasma haemocanis]AEW45738.1 hypothetical protein MHC_04410 [Mycoplasma haemocanis str. Illinois]